MFRLYRAGISPADIARQCEEGTTGCAPFPIPRRSVHEIVTAMAREAGEQRPESPDDLKADELIDRFPACTARILDRLLTRIEDKPQPSRRDLENLSQAIDVWGKLTKRLGKGSRPASTSPPSNPVDKPGGGDNGQWLEELAEELAEKGELGGDGQLSPAHTPTETEDPAADEASPAPFPDPVSAADQELPPDFEITVPDVISPGARARARAALGLD